MLAQVRLRLAKLAMAKQLVAQHRDSNAAR